MYTVTARLDENTQVQLEKLAESTDRSRSWHVAEAVKQYLATQTWQIEAIEKGVKEANAGNFATEDEVADAFARWGVHVK